MEQKKGIAYRPKAVKHAFEGSGLSKILDNITPVDFCEALYAEEKPEVLDRIKQLKHLLQVDEFKSKHQEIRKELSLFTPSTAELIPIIILNFLEVTESANEERLALFEDGRYRVYTAESHCWKIVDDKLLLLFLAELAEKSGLSRVEALKKKTIEELKFQFDLSALINTPEKSPNISKINLRNGTFIISKEFVGLREHRSNDYFNYTLPFDYDPNATCPRFLEYLNRAIPEKECQMMLGEFAAYPLFYGGKLEKAAVLYGPGGSGKSTFCEILTEMYGAENIGPYSLSSLCGTKESCSYNRADLKKYILNYSSEMGGKDTDDFLVKKVISREPIEARKPYGEPFVLRDYCPVMFNVNEMPPMENTSAMRRRICIAPFLNPIADKDMDREFAAKIAREELSGIFNWTLEGLNRLMINKNFTKSPLGESVARSLWVENDNVLAFIETETYVPSPDKYKLSVSLYSSYKEFCKENNYRPLSCIKFLKRLEGIHFVVDRQATNHQTRVYCKKQCDEEKQREEDLEKVMKRAKLNYN